MEIAERDLKKTEERFAKEELQHEKDVEERKAAIEEHTLMVNSLQNAVQVLSKHNKSLIQERPALIQSISSVLHFATQKAKIERGFVPPKSNNSFLQSSDAPEATIARALGDNFEPTLNIAQSARTLNQFVQTQSQAPAHLSTFENQSGGIFGILQQMQKDFTADLNNLKQEQTDSIKMWANLKNSLTDQLKNLRSSKDDAKANLGESKYFATEGKAALETTKNAVSADKEVLTTVNNKCQDLGFQYDARVKARAAETESVSQAIEILTNDESRALLSPSFIQVSSKTRSKTMSKSEKAKRALASSILKSAAKAYDNFGINDKISMLNQAKLSQQKQKLMLVAQKTKLAAFTEVNKMIDDMVVDLKQQMTNDVDSRDQCQVDIHSNEDETKKKERLSDVTQSNIEGLEGTIAQIDTDIENLKAAVVENNQSIKDISAEREEENAEFQKSNSEQQGMISVLQKAYDVLKAHYAKGESESEDSYGTPSFIQLKQTPSAMEQGLTDMPEGGFTDFQANRGSNAVLALFEKIVGDCHADIAETTKDDTVSQAEYETFVVGTNKANDAANEEIANLQEDKANKGGKLAEEKTTLADTGAEVEFLQKTNTALHGECDFVLQYFTQRQDAMQNEIEACNRAKAILSGAQ